MTKRLWPFLIACCLLVGAAFAHGLRADRWGTTVDLTDAAQFLDQIPSRIGDWESVDVKLPEEQVTASHAARILSRRYTHKYTREEVTVLLLCGRPGPISVHTPDICYTGAGFVIGPSREEALDDNNSAWVADFKRGEPSEMTLRIHWAWNAGEIWVASGSPRMDFARTKLLYKLYLVRVVPPTPKPNGNSPDIEFAKSLFPAIKPYLFPKP